MLLDMETNREMRRMALMHRMKQPFNIMPRACQSAARIKSWTQSFTVQRAAMSPTSPLNKFSNAKHSGIYALFNSM